MNLKVNITALPLDLPDAILKTRGELLGSLGVKEVGQVARAIMSMSDFYAMHPEKSSPWYEKWAQIAYLAYYMPLNWWRLCGVIGRGQQLDFFNGFDHLIDFGSGLGSVGMAFEAHQVVLKSMTCVETASVAIRFHQQLVPTPSYRTDWTSTAPKKVAPRTLAVFSYSLTELTALPDWTEECEGLMIVEPSTKEDSRRLQALRQKLLDSGWYVWGPCTHSVPCPLLTHSKTDWCHDRFEWQQPPWMKDIEANLPIKNGTLPCSWLMMRRTRPTIMMTSMNKKLARMTGDQQVFKGYAKQLICRGPDREFVAWQRKYFENKYPDVPRGSLVAYRDHIPKKSDELRPTEHEDIVGIAQTDLE